MIRFNHLINVTSKIQLHKFISKETRLYSTDGKSNSNPISRLNKLKFTSINTILLQKRNLNQDTNAAGVWDPFPGKFFLSLFIVYVYRFEFLFFENLSHE